MNEMIPWPKDVSAPRLVNKYAHDLTDERGWELYVAKGRLVFRLELNLPGLRPFRRQSP